MTSRVLQENTSLLLTEASEPLQNDNFIGASSVVAGSPVVASSGIAQVHSLSGSNVSTDNPVTSSVGIAQWHDLTCNSITSGSPATSVVEFIQKHGLSPTSISGSSPTLPIISIVEDEGLAPISLVAGSPTISSSGITQEHNISPASFTTRRPDVGTTTDPDWLIKQEIQELQQMFGGWPRRAYEVPDGRLVQAEREIESTFGDKVSVDRKAKSLLKFGKSATLVANTRATVWSVGGMETYVQDNLIDAISSSSASDSEEIYLECHTVTGTGTDQQFTFMTQTVSLNGQNKVLLPTPVARVSRVYNNNGTELVGAVYVYEDTAITAGVPNDITKVHAQIPQGFQQSFKAATTFSNEDYYILTGGFGSVSNKQAANVDFYLEYRTPGKVFRQGAAVSASSTGGSWSVELDPAIIIPKNADVRITCEASANGAVVFGSFKGYIAKVL